MTSSSHGGRRAGAGRPATIRPITTIALSPQARQELSILTLNQRGVRNNPDLSQRAVLEEIIHARWLEYSAAIRDAEEAAHDLA